MNYAEASDRWRGRKGLALGLRIAILLAPIAASFATSLLASRYLPHTRLGMNKWLWWIGVIAGATIVLLATERAARRFLPLAALLKLSLVFPDEAPNRFKAAMRTGTARQLKRRLAELDADHSDRTTGEYMLDLLTLLAEHDRMTRGHSERVRAYCDMIADEMKLSQDDRDKLHWAALLHDLGKLHVPAEVLNKDGRPTDAEYEVIKGHPAAGLPYVEPLRAWLGDWLHALDQHHERWDGRGYPHGLHEEQIHLSGRIVAVADAFDVITSARSYKQPLAPAIARQEISDCAGRQFDPMVVRAFLNIGLGRLRLAVGPLAWLNSFPSLADSALLPAAGSVASGAATVGLATVASVTGLWPEQAPEAPPATIAFEQSVDQGLTVDELDVGVDEDDSVRFVVTGTTGDAVVVRIVVGPAHGAAALVDGAATRDGAWTQSVQYTPNQGFVGSDILTVEACDATGCATANIEFAVTRLERRPEPSPDAVEVIAGERLTVPVATLLANDTDPDGDELTVTDVTAGRGIEATLADGRLVIDASADFVGLTIVAYTVCDPSLLCNAGMVSVLVTPGPRPPEPSPDAVDGAEDVSGTISASRLLANDTDPDGDELTLADAGAADGLVVTLTEAGVAYTPEPDRSGPVTFTYTACDTTDLCATAAVTVSLRPTPDAPVATDDVLATDRDTPGSISVAALLANDTDADGDELSVVDVDDEVDVTATIGTDGMVTCSPEPGFVGSASFRYTVCDPSGLCDTAIVGVTVIDTNRVPIAGDDTGLGFVTAEDTTLLTPDVTANDTDTDDPVDPTSVTLVGAAGDGTAVHNGDGTFTYTPNADFNGTDTFSYTITDPDGAVSEPATVTIGVAAVNDAPVADDDSGLGFATTDDTPFTTTSVTANDIDVDDAVDPTTVLVTGGPSVGVLAHNGDGTFDYTPVSGFDGTATFTYTIEDSSGAVSAPAVVTIAVVDVNSSPIAADDGGAGFSTDEDGGPFVTADVTTNDTDADHPVDPSTVEVVAAAANGTAVHNGDGTFTYTPDADFFGTDTFTYTIEDPEAAVSDPATVTVTVDAVNDEPDFAGGSPVSVLEDVGPVTVAGWATSITAGAANESGQTLTFNATNDNAALFLVQPSVDVATGDLTFTPAPDANGAATVDTWLTDDGGTANGGDDRSPTRAFTLTVGAVNDAPSFTDDGDPAAVLEDAGAQNLVAWATAITPGPADESGQTLTFNVTANSNPALFAAGPAIDPGSGDLSYTPADDANGTATVTFTVSDDGGLLNGGADTSVGHTVMFTVTAVSDPPTLDTNVTTSVTGLGTVTITNADLAASDIDNPATDLFYTITSGPTDGAIKRLGVTVGSFTQDDIDNSRITYEHTGGTGASDTIDFDLTDGTGSGTVSDEFKIGIVPSGVVLSEFRTSGPGGGTDEFIEIYNSGPAGVDLTDWKLRVTGFINSDFYTFPTVVLEPNQHFLVAHDSAPLAGSADDTWSGLNYGTWGDIVLKDELDVVVDVVGFDSGGNPILFEGTKLPAYPGGTQDRSYERLAGSPSGNCVDTDDNSADWFFSAVASPQSTSDPKVAC